MSFECHACKRDVPDHLTVTLVARMRDYGETTLGGINLCPSCLTGVSEIKATPSRALAAFARDVVVEALREWRARGRDPFSP